ncbi:MAG: hypothetical protein P8P74_00565 [Crocinitomicaceae bacterium]|nr:hypothetical protein [Crocinitomicaceae bacterium]
MIFDGTYIDKETKEALEAELGKPFGVISRFKQGGIGSHRMIIEKSSTGFSQIMDRATGTVYGSVELRPKGILIHFNVKNTRHSWSIPFFRIVFYRTDYFSIHSEGEFISFRKDRMLKRNKSFFDRLLIQRNEYIQQFQSPFD